ncbi:MAG TPA: UTP--glucose-1-phosphate uridylyltransferase GalU, partial [Steroidobacteraceae bacterium]
MAHSNPIRAAVFPVAGRGTRFLPATKASPKEMLPIVDKPLIQYAAEEALSAGASNLVFITGSAKRAIEDHFDSDRELEAALEAQGKHELLDSLRGILPSWASCVYIRQPAPLGLGHAVLCAQELVADEPFAAVLADDVIDAERPCLRQLLDVYDRYGCPVIAVMEVPRESISAYGCIDAEQVDERTFRIRNLVEKPKASEAPSNLAIIGRYVLTPDVFRSLESIQPGAGGEIQLTDGLKHL